MLASFIALYCRNLGVGLGSVAGRLGTILGPQFVFLVSVNGEPGSVFSMTRLKRDYLFYTTL